MKVSKRVPANGKFKCWAVWGVGGTHALAGWEMCVEYDIKGNKLAFHTFRIGKNPMKQSI